MINDQSQCGAGMILVASNCVWGGGGLSFIWLFCLIFPVIFPLLFLDTRDERRCLFCLFSFYSCVSLFGNTAKKMRKNKHLFFLFSFCDQVFSCITRSLSLFVGRNIISNIYFFVSIEKKKSQKRKKNYSLINCTLTNTFDWLPGHPSDNNNLDKRKKRNNNFDSLFLSSTIIYVRVSLYRVHDIGKESMRDEVNRNASLY